jgi:hypothetical protein
MPTLEQLMSEAGLAPSSAGGQQKTASATGTVPAAGSSSSDAVNEVLEGLGLINSEDDGSETDINKQASQEGQDVSLRDIYQDVFSDDVADTESEDLSKTASEEGEEGQVEETETEEGGEEGESEDGSGIFGQVTGHYFNAAAGEYLDKVAASLEAEAGKGHQPLGYGQYMPQNAPTGTNEGAKVSGSKTPYDMTANSPILSRIATSRAQVGARRD